MAAGVAELIPRAEAVVGSGDLVGSVGVLAINGQTEQAMSAPGSVAAIALEAATLQQPGQIIRERGARGWGRRLSSGFLAGVAVLSAGAELATTGCDAGMTNPAFVAAVEHQEQTNGGSWQLIKTSTRRLYWCVVGAGNAGTGTIQAGTSLGDIINDLNGRGAVHEIVASAHRWGEAWAQCIAFRPPPQASQPAAPSSIPRSGGSKTVCEQDASLEFRCGLTVVEVDTNGYVSIENGPTVLAGQWFKLPNGEMAKIHETVKPDGTVTRMTMRISKNN